MIKCLASNILCTLDDLDAALEQAGRQGYAGVQMTFAANFQVLTQPDEAAINKFLQKLQEQSITIPALAAQGLDLFRLATGRENQEEMEQLFTPLLQLAHRMNPEAIVVIPALPMQPEDLMDFSYEAAFHQLFLRLDVLTAAAQRQRVNLALENPSHHLLLSPLELRDLIDQINSPHLGICFNIEHTRRLGEPIDWAEILNHRIFALKMPALPPKEQTYNKVLSYLETLHSAPDSLHFSPE